MPKVQQKEARIKITSYRGWRNWSNGEGCLQGLRDATAIESYHPGLCCQEGMHVSPRRLHVQSPHGFLK